MNLKLNFGGHTPHPCGKIKISNWKCYGLAVFNNLANLVYGVGFSCSFHGAIAEWIDWINWLNWLIATSRHRRPHSSSFTWQIPPHVTRLTDSPFDCWHDACAVTYSSRFRFRLRMIGATRGKSRLSVLGIFCRTTHKRRVCIARYVLRRGEPSLHAGIVSKQLTGWRWFSRYTHTHTHTQCRQYYTVLRWSTIQNQVESINNASSRMQA